MLFIKYRVLLDETNETITILRESAMRLKVNDKVTMINGEGTITKIML